MTVSRDVPCLFAWAGGDAAFRRLFSRFYERVSQDAVLAPVFASMDQRHAEHVAAFVAEVFGGPSAYSAHGGSHAAMISKHMGRKLTHEQRRAWMALLLDTADEIGLPDDPEFRASFVAYLEWGSRLAVMNSREGADEPHEDLPMPAWTWTSPGGPYEPSS